MIKKPTLAWSAVVLFSAAVIGHFATQRTQPPASSAPVIAPLGGDSALPTLPSESAHVASDPRRLPTDALPSSRPISPGTARAPSALTHSTVPLARPGSAPAPAASAARATVETNAPAPAAAFPEDPAIPRPPTRELTLGNTAFELGAGVRVPAALLESETELPPALAKAKEAIARGFEREVLDTAERPGESQSLDRKWPAAKARADAQFRALFGEAAFNEWTMQAAREALPAKPR